MEITLNDEIYPVLYTSLEGIYTCKVQVSDHQAMGTFHVTSKLYNCIVLYWLHQS